MSLIPFQNLLQSKFIFYHLLNYVFQHLRNIYIMVIVFIRAVLDTMTTSWKES